MRVAVSSYSFGDYLSKDKMGIRGCMEWAKEQGFEGFELVQHNLERYDVDLNEVAEYSKEFDLPIVAYLASLPTQYAGSSSTLRKLPISSISPKFS